MKKYQIFHILVMWLGKALLSRSALKIIMIKFCFQFCVNEKGMTDSVDFWLIKLPLKPKTANLLLAHRS